MAAQEFTCPNCGAPIDYDGSDVPTLRCPFCDTSVMVPAELRPKPVVQPPPIPDFTAYTSTVSSRRQGSPVAIIAAAVFVLIMGAVVVLVFLINPADRSTTIIERITPGEPTQVSGRLVPSQVPTLTPTPSFAQLQTTFGSKGIGVGKLNDARMMAIDGSGTVYVADYEGGRIQAFDADGKFLHLWQVGDSHTHIYSMAANHEGILFVAYDGDIYRYDGTSGKLLDKIEYANGPEFGDLAITPDGGLVGVWYEGRWGLITTLVGHREDLAWFDAEGNTLNVLESFISGQTEHLALDVLLAVDGLGTVYAYSEEEVFKFTPEGKFVTRFSAQGDPSASSTYVDSIAVDGAGRVYLAGSRQISIFSPDGRFIRSFELDTFARKIAFNEKGELYVLSGDQVSRYQLAD